MRPNSSPQNPLNLSLKYLTIRARSVKELHDYLLKKGFTSTEINQTIEKLKELKFLNDENFARSFIENRQRKGKSKNAIAFELKQKGINKNHSESILVDANDDLKTALEYIEKRLHQFDRFDKIKRKQRIISRLSSRRFSWDVISKVLASLKI